MTAVTPDPEAAVPPVLLLFDIDGTLVEPGASRSHLAAVHAAIRDVYGMPDPAAAGIRASGKTDLRIAAEILAAGGYTHEHFRLHADRYCAAAAAQYETRCPTDLSGYVIDGIPALLAGLAARTDVRLGLLTGNIRKIALRKLDAAGLAGFFSPVVGSWGCDAEDRIQLAPIARARAGAGDVSHPRERTMIIGDTPGDIACAHADRIRCAAVTTGRYTADQLTAADSIAHDATELSAIIALELSSLLPAQPQTRAVGQPRGAGPG